jgi:hypothetical protein
MKKTTTEILAEREKTHGRFADHARITQCLKAAMREPGKWDYMSCAQREALEMIQHKIGRILSGNPNERDHWADIAGYAELVVREIDKMNEGIA